tara:strand:+ start:2716 stop:2928 length:213 start_codon:yes stop_codon:yes gene_type:complete
MNSLPGQMSLFNNSTRKVGDIFDKYIDYSDLGKTQAMERELDVLTDFVNKYGETMIPLLERYLGEQTNAA